MSLAPAGAAKPPHILTLVIATATGALSMNVFLPSLPGMARHFDTPYSTVQLAVSLYLVAIAVLQIFLGPASDRFGRRPVMLWSLALFLLGTVCATFATSIEALLFFRLVQAFSAGGIVISRAVVRDTSNVDEAASKLGLVTMGMSLVPMVAPIIGGMLDEHFGWRATFVFAGLLGAIALGVVFADLRETNAQRSSSLFAQMRTYPEILRSRRFWGYATVATLSSGAFFAFLGGGPFVATEILGMKPSDYGLYYGLMSLGFLIGAFGSARLSRRMGINGMMLFGESIATVGMALAILLAVSGYTHPFALFGPLVFTGIGNGLTIPNANAGVVSVHPHLAGSAAGLAGALQIGGGALITVLTGHLLSVESGPYPLLVIMMISSGGAFLAAYYVARVARSARPIL